MLEAYKAFWRQSFDFRGKTTRVNFWLASAANAVVLIGVIAIGAALVALLGDGATAIPLTLAIIYGFAAVVPNLSIQIRRLRDAGFSPWSLLICLVPYIGGIALFVLYLRPSKAR